MIPPPTQSDDYREEGKAMGDKKIIGVAGSTEAQGGGPVRAILDGTAGNFATRVLTRNPSSEAARTLAAAGTEVVAADLDDVDSIKHAFVRIEYMPRLSTSAAAFEISRRSEVRLS
jgi:uncharacterized protein YbjT (DUF2867 family)